MENKQKNADDLSEIMSAQLDKLTAGGVTEEDVHVADAIANMIGKMLKHDALRIAYAAIKDRTDLGTIASLEARGSKLLIANKGK